jgi:hypothetical protein
VSFGPEPGNRRPKFCKPIDSTQRGADFRHRLVPGNWQVSISHLIVDHRVGETPFRRPRNTRIWQLEAALKCRLCRKGRYAPPVHMIKLTETREITPYKWVHPDEEG